jgi:hypothetical protein
MNPYVYERDGKWFFRTEDDGEMGPFSTKGQAESMFDRYCYDVLGDGALHDDDVGSE